MTDRSAAARRSRVLLFLLLTAAVVGCSSGGAVAGEKAESSETAGAKHAEEGEEGRGGVPGRVTLGEAAFATARIEVEAAGAEDAATGAAEVPGQVELDPARVAHVSPRVGGRIERLTVVPGDRVGAGQAVAYVTSPAVLSAQNDLVLALRRAQSVAGTEDAAGAEALVSAAERRLALMGAGGAAARLRAGGAPSPVVAVSAPFAGSVLETLTLAGSAVEPGTPIFRMADLSSLYVAADVPERALPILRVGQGATVRLQAYPDFEAAGRVERIADAVDPQTRTVKAMIRVPNPRRILRPGMFATARLDLGGAGPSAQAGGRVSIPETALVTDGDGRFAFVEVGERTYERRAVEVIPGGQGGRVFVISGIAPGERVVVRGAFTLKSELGKAAFGDDD